MAAIWGAISIAKDKKISEEVKKIFKDAFLDCVIDRTEELETDFLYMGCGLQYWTRETQYEDLPRKQKGIFFNGDIIIDNRAELIKKLGMNNDENTTDSDILFSMYEKYGNDALNQMIGAYAAVWYNEEKENITVLADAVGYRFIYYTIKDGVFYYASLMKPLETIIGDVKLNERWIADSIGQDNLNIFTECEETPIQDIYRIAPAHRMVISRKGIDKHQYWKPYEKVKKVRYKSQDEYKNHFLTLFQTCVDEVMRSPKETAILLSGGYDSTAVACLASRTLKKQGKQLYSFTSVPLKNSEIEKEEGMFVDETDLVRKTADILENLECTFMELPNMNSWYDRKEYMKVAEIPYKSPQNLLWMYEGLKQAYEKDARIMLGGMFGNGTVSFDNTKIYFAWLFQRGRWVKLYSEVKGLNRRKHYTKKSVLVTTAREAVGIGATKVKREELFEKSFVKQSYLEKYETDERIFRWYRKYDKCSYNYKAYRESFITMDVLRHYGEFAQKNSLYTGVIVRDPTRDKRMIEFVAGIPYDQFTHDGYQRRLISDYMKDIMPEHVLKQTGVGRQSADQKFRLLKYQKDIKKEWMEIYRHHAQNERIDVEKAMRELEAKTFDELTDFELVRHIFTLILLEYIDSVKKR